MLRFFSSSILFLASSLAFAAADLAPPEAGEAADPAGDGVFFFCAAVLRVGFGLLVAGVDGDMRDDESILPACGEYQHENLCYYCSSLVGYKSTT